MTPLTPVYTVYTLYTMSSLWYGVVWVPTYNRGSTGVVLGGYHPYLPGTPPLPIGLQARHTSEYVILYI